MLHLFVFLLIYHIDIETVQCKFNPHLQGLVWSQSCVLSMIITNEHNNLNAAAKSLQSCSTLCDPRDGSPTRLFRPWDSPGKNTGVGCHFLLQCMRVKSKSEVAQSCLTLCDSMDCSPPGSSIHGIFQARVLE